MMFVNNPENHPADIVDRVAAVLAFLADVMCPDDTDMEIRLSPSGVDGFVALIMEMRDTLNAQTGRIST
jgi:hypothetical protein